MAHQKGNERMKLLITSALAAALATGALAGNSDRYNDVRLDTAFSNLNDFTETPKATKRPVKQINAPTFSTRNARRDRASGSYAYTNPHGVGPNNDSR